MTINLPLASTLPPKWRILRAKTWGATWEILPTDGRLGTSTITRKGWFHVEEFWRSCIPEPGQAIISFEMGQIDGQDVGIDEDSTTLRQDYIELTGSLIRIQCAPNTGNDTDTPEWRTVWLGGCEMHSDSFAPGADHVLGTRTYHCIDLLAFYLKRQPMDHHGVYVALPSPRYFLHCYGHPGYNSCDWSGRVIGNKSAQAYYDDTSSQVGQLPWTGEVFPSGAIQTAFRSKLICHTHAANSANTWTDLEAVENAMAASRPKDTPFFYIYDNDAMESLLASVNSWPINPGMMVYDFLAQIFRRQRGRGVAFLSWDDDVADPAGQMVPYIVVNPQHLDTIEYRKPTDGSSTQIKGATANSSTVTVDLQGDHRNIASTFQLGDRYQHSYDWVESAGEYMQVLATIDFAHGARNINNSAQERWSAQDETDFGTAHTTDASDVKHARYDMTWQMIGLNLSWAGDCGNGDGTSSYALCDYRCSDKGAIVLTINSLAANDTCEGLKYRTSPVLCKILDDLPLYNGYNYTSTPVPWDGATPDQSPSRQKIRLYVRNASGRFVDATDDDAYKCQVHNTPHGIVFSSSTDKSDGTRKFSDESDYGGDKAHTALVATVGIELPHRVRMATGGTTMVDGTSTPVTELTAKRKLTIYHPGLHLWVASPKAIWDITGTANGDGFTTVTAACGSTDVHNPGKLRDDRDRLAAMHHLACSWYLYERRTATWQLKACGFLPSFESCTEAGDPTTATDVEYPTLGELVTTLTAAGDDYTINTPITKVHFTNAGNGVTTWVTDWCDLDFR